MYLKSTSNSIGSCVEPLEAKEEVDTGTKPEAEDLEMEMEDGRRQ